MTKKIDLSKEEWGMIAMAIEAKVKELAERLPEPVASQYITPFAQLHSKVLTLLAPAKDPEKKE